MRKGRPIPRLRLSPSERQTLEGWTRRRTSAQAVALRSRVILLAAAGRSNTEVAHALRVGPYTLQVAPALGVKLRGTFLQERFREDDDCP